MIKTSELIWQDTQHQVLFQLIDRIREVPYDHEITNKFKPYAEHHFVLEEAYMKPLDYPDAAAHIQAHNRFRDELTAMTQADPDMSQAFATRKRSLSKDGLTLWLTILE